MSRTPVFLGILACLSAVVASAQSHPTTGGADTGQQVDAWVVTAHMKVRTVLPGAMSAPDNPGPIGSALVTFTHAGTNSYIAFAPNPDAGPWEMSQFIPIGMTFLINSADTLSPVTTLDSARKIFNKVEVQNGFFPSPPRGHHPSPDDPVTHVKDVVVTVENVGAGPTLQGHPTVHYRQTQRATIQTDAGPMMTIILRMVDTTDLDIATDIPNAPTIEAMGLPQVDWIPVGFPMMRPLMSAIQGVQGKYPRGVILHMEDHQGMGTMTRLISLDVDHWERTKVNASLFTVPSNYTAQPGPGGAFP